VTDSTREFSKNVVELEYEDKTIYLIGTAHISKRSVEEVEEVIRAVKPDVVCVELDQMRYEALTDETRWRNLDIFQVIREKKLLFLFASLVLSAYQRKMGEVLGVKPGAELLAGVETAKEVGAEVVLADRNIQATLKRTWANLGFFAKARVASGLVASYFASDKLTVEQIEELKDRDNISDTMNEFAKIFPSVKKPLIDERDLYLISMIREAERKEPADEEAKNPHREPDREGTVIVGVVGAGHLDGMIENLESDVDRDALNVIPEPSLVGKVAAWIVPIVLTAALVYALVDQDYSNLLDLVTAFVLPTSIGATVGAIIAGGHPLTILTAMVGAPFAAASPALPLAALTAPVEAYFRRPRVADCERIIEDSKSLRGYYKNRFLRVILVALVSMIGCAIGTWTSMAWLVSMFDWTTVGIALGVIVVLLVAAGIVQRRRNA
jgi:pheromone shutdown-related protein TraB